MNNFSTINLLEMSFSRQIFFIALLINSLPILLTYLSSFLFIVNIKQNEVNWKGAFLSEKLEVFTECILKSSFNWSLFNTPGLTIIHLRDLVKTCAFLIYYLYSPHYYIISFLCLIPFDFFFIKPGLPRLYPNEYTW